MKLDVLGPDVNESYRKFSVNQNGAVRFGMGAIKGVGTGAVATIVENRKEDGPYKSIFDMAKRIDLRAANKKAFESLALAGGFDSFTETHRGQYFHQDGDSITFLEKAMKYGSKYQENENSSQVSLFGEASDVQIPEPVVPPCEEWGTMEKLAREKEVVGIYLSGHPLDDFKYEMKYFCNGTLSVFADLENNLNREVSFGGVITGVEHRTSKNGKGWATFTIEDYNTAHEFRIFGEDYLKHRPFLVQSTDVLETYARKLTIQLDINELSDKRIDALKELLTEHSGNHTLNFVIFEMAEKLKLHMPSRKQKVNISQELLTANMLDS